MQSYFTSINHFSHPHPLDLVDAAGWSRTTNPPLCSGCKTKVSGWTYTCSRRCNFFIHAGCTLNPTVINHPAHFHSSHSLTLLATPAYPSGSFRCDSCGYHGDGFSYRCTTPGCDFDLHMACALMPLTITHRSHVHSLSLNFSPPPENRAFRCDLCKLACSNQLLYSCRPCNFDAHLGCVAAANQPAHASSSWAPPQPQQSFTFPGVVGAYPNHVIGQNVNTPARIGFHRPGTTPSFVTGLVAALAQGSVTAIAQQAAQSIMHYTTGGGETSPDAAGDNVFANSM